MTKKNVFLIDYPQDLDLLLPILRRRGSVPAEVWVTTHALGRSPRISAQLQSAGTPWRTIARFFLERGWVDIRSISVLITACESNLPPHRAAHRLAIKCRNAGIPSVTLQHGFENAGISYFEPGFDVRFASSEIWVWGGEFLKNPSIHPDDKSRMMPMGIPKDYDAAVLPRPVLNRGAYRAVVSVFENLHWSRYTAEYRKSFIEDLCQSMEQNHSVLFLIKPHHDERWLGRNPLKKLPPNSLLADPRNPLWQPYTAPSLIAVSDAVITTPSTVALDAAMMNKPVAVAAYGLDLNCYNPLFFLRSIQDWNDIIDFSARADMFSQANQTFRKIWLDEKNAVENILERLKCLQAHD